MKFEHYAINVPEPREMAQWYVEHLGFKIARQNPEPPYMHFLADEDGRIVVEIYNNPKGPIHDFKNMNPFSFHFALVSGDARADCERLTAAGASVAFEDALPDGSLLMMMRDPWGVPMQLCQRAKPF